MIDINTLFDFSRNHCIAICAALVPANLIATLQVLLFAGFGRSLAQVQLIAAVASGYALIMLLHVYTWFAVGIVMAPTYILTLLACVCLLINGGAVLYRRGWFALPQLKLATWLRTSQVKLQ
jgi:hypothetical protein